MSTGALSNYTLSDWQGAALRELAAAGGRFESINSANREIVFGEGDMTQPFGGYKQSGHARDNRVESILGYAQNKSTGLPLSA